MVLDGQQRETLAGKEVLEQAYPQFSEDIGQQRVVSRHLLRESAGCRFESDGAHRVKAASFPPDSRVVLTMPWSVSVEAGVPDCAGVRGSW
jgi:hypothetical protein